MVINDPRARFATLSSARAWIPPCHAWSTFARRWELPRRWSLCLEGQHHKRRSAPLVRLCSARLPAIVHSSALDRRVSASASKAAVPADALFESAYDTRSRSCPRLRMAVCVVVGGHLSTQTCSKLIDRSSCLVEPAARQVRELYTDVLVSGSSLS